MLSKILKDNKGVIISVLKSVFIRLLKIQSVGGFKGWLIKTLVTEFSKEVFEFIDVHVSYFEIKRKVNDTVNMEDRNEAADNLNDVFNS